MGLPIFCTIRDQLFVCIRAEKIFELFLQFLNYYFHRIIPYMFALNNTSNVLPWKFMQTYALLSKLITFYQLDRSKRKKN